MGLGCHLLVLGPTLCAMGPGTPCLLGLLLGVPVCLRLCLRRGLRASEHPSPVAHRHVVAAIEGGCSSWGPNPAPVPIPVLESLSPRHAHIPLQCSLLSTAPSPVQDTPVWPHPPPPWSSSSPALLPLYNPFLAHCSITLCGTLSAKPVPVHHLSKAHKAPCLSGPQQPSSAAATVAASPQGLCTCPSACPRPPFSQTFALSPFSLFCSQYPPQPSSCSPVPISAIRAIFSPFAQLQILISLCPTHPIHQQALASVLQTTSRTNHFSLSQCSWWGFQPSCFLPPCQSAPPTSPSPASLWGTWEL